MNRTIMLIWDFYGSEAEPMAEHHAKHLKEFATRENITFYDCGVNNESSHSEAFIVVKEADMIMVRDSLRPKRGRWVE